MVPLAGAPHTAGGAAAAAFLAAGFVELADPVARQSLSVLATLLYCIGFGYALLGLSSARLTLPLHLGVAGLSAGAIVETAVGATPVGAALSAAGGALLMAAMWKAAAGVEPGARRLAVLVAGTSPALFALHALVFASSGDLLAARFLRLGATAAVALPLLAMRYRGDHLPDTTRATRIARTLFAVGMIAMPVTLVLSALVDERAKYALGPASDCFTVGLLIACFQAWRVGDRAALAGFGTVLASMALGKVMGFYAFDGPFPAPAPLAAYADAWRVALRHFHIDLMVVGYTFLIWPALVRLRVVAAAGLALALGLSVPAMGAGSLLAAAAAAAWAFVFWRSRAAA
jgi:hypothetical protein